MIPAPVGASSLRCSSGLTYGTTATMTTDEPQLPVDRITTRTYIYLSIQFVLELRLTSEVSAQARKEHSTWLTPSTC